MRLRGPKRLRTSAVRRFAAALRTSSLRVDAERARNLLASGGMLVDVRRHDDPSGWMDGALRIAPDAIPARLEELPRGRPVVLACT